MTAREVIEDLYRHAHRERRTPFHWEIRSYLDETGFPVSSVAEKIWDARMMQIGNRRYSRWRDKKRAYRRCDLQLADQLDREREGE